MGIDPDLAPEPEWIVAETTSDVDSLVGDVLRLERRRPLVCLTTRHGEQEAALDPDEVRAIVGSEATIWIVPSGELTSRLRERLPRLAVDDGAARIFWPGADGSSAGRDHPLIVDRTGVYDDGALDELEEHWRTGPIDHDRVPTAVNDELRVLRNERVHWLRKHAELAADLVAAYRRNEALLDRARRAEERIRRERPAAQQPREERDLDTAGRFHVLIASEWAGALHPEERPGHLLASIVLKTPFVIDLEQMPDKRHRRVAWVCAMVACGRATSMGLEVHPFRSGMGASDAQRVRSDGAKAWRCAIEVNTPAAYRLHYWIRRDGVVEFANVGPHDRMRIDE